MEDLNIKLLEGYLTEGKDNKEIEIQDYEDLGTEIKVWYYWYTPNLETISLFDLISFVYSKNSVSF